MVAITATVSDVTVGVETGAPLVATEAVATIEVGVTAVLEMLLM